MPYGTSTLLIRNLSDVFGENDPARRRAAIDEMFIEDCVFYDPKGGVYRGRRRSEGQFLQLFQKQRTTRRRSADAVLDDHARGNDGLGGIFPRCPSPHVVRSALNVLLNVEAFARHVTVSGLAQRRDLVRMFRTRRFRRWFHGRTSANVEMAKTVFSERVIGAGGGKNR